MERCLSARLSICCECKSSRGRRPCKLFDQIARLEAEKAAATELINSHQQRLDYFSVYVGQPVVAALNLVRQAAVVDVQDGRIGIALQNTTLFLADYNNHVLRKLELK